MLRFYKGTLNGIDSPDRLVVHYDLIQDSWLGYLYDPEMDICFTSEDNNLEGLISQYEDEVCDPSYKIVSTKPDESFDFRAKNRTGRLWNMRSWDIDFFKRVMRDQLHRFSGDVLKFDYFFAGYCGHVAPIMDRDMIKAIFKQAHIPYSSYYYDSRYPEKIRVIYVRVDSTAKPGSEEIYPEIWVKFKNNLDHVVRIR